MQSLSITAIERRAQAAGFTLQDIARRAGISPATVWRIAKGKSRPLAQTLEQLTVALEAAEADRITQIETARGAAA